MYSDRLFGAGFVPDQGGGVHVQNAMQPDLWKLRFRPRPEPMKWPVSAPNSRLRYVRPPTTLPKMLGQRCRYPTLLTLLSTKHRRKHSGNTLEKTYFHRSGTMLSGLPRKAVSPCPEERPMSFRMHGGRGPSVVDPPMLDECALDAEDYSSGHADEYRRMRRFPFTQSSAEADEHEPARSPARGVVASGVGGLGRAHDRRRRTSPFEWRDARCLPLPTLSHVPADC